MKKLLLLSAAALVAGSASAGVLTQPTQIDNFPIRYVSPDGRYAASSIFGAVVFYDLQENKETRFEVSEGIEYSLGHPGASIANDGTCVGIFNGSQAVYLDAKTGKWITLPTPTEDDAGAWGITPDGSVIVGYIGNRAENIDENEEDNIMNVPVYWTRNSDGTYSQPVELPYPAKDFSNRKPQFVMAGVASDDGSRIVGQMVDAYGAQAEPIYWTKVGSQWQYKILGEKLLNPNNVKFPDYYTAPEFPQAYNDYMTPAQQQEYDNAYSAWENGGYEGDAPAYTDFMDADAKKVYEEKMAEYQKWSAMFDEWYAAYDECLMAAPVYTENDVMFNGNTAVFNAVKADDSDPEAFFPEELPLFVTFDVATGNHKFYTEGEMQATTISYDGDILCYTGDPDMQASKQAYVFPAGKDKPVEIAEWLKNFNEEYPDWVKENMTHKVTEYQPNENGEWAQVTVDKLFSGEPNSTCSFNLLALYTPATWDGVEDGLGYVSYLLPIDVNAAIETVQASTIVTGPAVYYNLQGMRVENPSNGIFIRVQNGETTKILVK